MTSEFGAPLSDLLVLDMTRALAGPIAGRMLSDLGADVEGPFRIYCRTMDRSDLREDSRFIDMPSRITNQDALNEIIDAWVGTMQTAAEVEAALGSSTILVADVRTATEIRDTEWASDREASVDIPVKPGTDPITVPQAPSERSSATGYRTGVVNSSPQFKQRPKVGAFGQTLRLPQ